MLMKMRLKAMKYEKVMRCLVPLWPSGVYRRKAEEFIDGKLKSQTSHPVKCRQEREVHI